jgi:hypothetical protein
MGVREPERPKKRKETGSKGRKHGGQSDCRVGPTRQRGCSRIHGQFIITERERILSCEAVVHLICGVDRGIPCLVARLVVFGLLST